MAINLFLLEDEVNVGSTLRDRLQIEGFQVTWARNIADAKKLLAANRYPLSILDVNLPDGSGFDIGRLIHDLYPSTAVVFLTAAGTPDDRIHGLELGAEDYIVKPFNYKELVLRLQKALHRADYISGKTQNETEIKIGRGQVRFHQYDLIVDGVRHSLTHKECALLKLLYEKRGNVVSRDEILNLVWSEDEYPTPRTIDNFILRLRKLLEPDPNSPAVIRSVRGVGYLLENPS